MLKLNGTYRKSGKFGLTKTCAMQVNCEDLTGTMVKLCKCCKNIFVFKNTVNLLVSGGLECI